MEDNRISEEMQHDEDQALMIEPLAVRISDIEIEKIPKKGMEFNSYEEIVEFYDEYAQRMGFGTKTRTSGMTNGIFSFLLTCDKEGRPRGNIRPSTKTDCKACIRGNQKRDGRYYLSQVVLDHNHLLTPWNAQYFRSSRKRRKKQLEVNGMARIPLGKLVDTITARYVGYEKIGGAGRDCRYHTNELRRLKLRKGDTEAIYQHFLCMQNKDPNFFYVMDLDDDGCLRNVFWADSRSRAAYKHFNDVISFDTAYLTNKYDTPLAPFVGVSHHGNLVLLGCALLADETIDTYVWLFKSYLSCMSGQPPKAIITDQCQSIRAAVVKVFPEARHRVCLWHIMRKLPEKFGGHDNYLGIKDTFTKAVIESLQVSEFEVAWQNMISNFGIEDNEWIESLHEIRELWVPVYLNDTFWAGMCTTQCTEGRNAYFDDYINAMTSLKQFLSQYEMALRSKYENEATSDFNSFNKMPKMKTNLKMEVQLSKLYTLDMFNQFQHELLNVINCHTLPIGGDEKVYNFGVKEIVDRGCGLMTKEYKVVFNTPVLEVQCNCQSFESRGILCCHALSALHSCGVYEIPDKYILPRWRKDYKQLHTSASLVSSACDSPNSAEERYTDIHKHCHQFAERGAISGHNYELAIKLIVEATKKLNVEDSVVLVSGSIDDKVMKVLDPLPPKRKGRPWFKRKQSSVEVAIMKKRIKVGTSSKKKRTQKEQSCSPAGSTCEGTQDVSPSFLREEEHCEN